jgi:hypothetical protein
MRTPFLAFSMVVLGFYLLLWGSQILFPGGTASTVVLVLTTLAGSAFVQPGWNIRPSRPVGYWAALFGLLLGSAVLAASVLRLSKIPTPYDITSFDIVRLLPGLMAMTGVEELLFRQVLFRWLEMQSVATREIVISTAIVFGSAHLGPLLIGGEVDGPFYLLQSLFMVLVGLLLGELRSVTNSWTMAWAGHATYNVTVLYLLMSW